MARALLEALDGIHAAGIVHRDVKAGNVLVDRGGRIMLTDFGIAQSREATKLTSPGMVIGTVHYTAPEVRKGGRATPASDLYACGVITRRPAQARGPRSRHPADRGAHPRGPRRAGRMAAAALDLLEHRPVEIPTDELRAERTPRDVLAESPPAAPTPPPPPAPRREPRSFPEPPDAGEPTRRRSAAFPIGIAAGLLLVGAIVAVALSMGGDDDSNDGRDGPRVVAQRRVTTTQTTNEPAPEEPAPEEDPPTAGTPVASGGDDPALGTQLNDKGYALLQAGDAAAALPKLEGAVAAFPEDSTDINYAYALFNYAQALRLTGDPASAIQLLEKRLAISDEQVPTVQAELAEAQAAAGGKKPKKPKKPKP